MGSLFYRNCEVSPCCFTLSFIVGCVWRSAQGVATSCSPLCVPSFVWWQMASLLCSDSAFTCISCVSCPRHKRSWLWRETLKTAKCGHGQHWRWRWQDLTEQIAILNHPITSVRARQRYCDEQKVAELIVCVQRRSHRNLQQQRPVDLLGAFATAASAQNGKCGILMHSWCWRIWGKC